MFKTHKPLFQGQFSTNWTSTQGILWVHSILDSTLKLKLH